MSTCHDVSLTLKGYCLSDLSMLQVWRMADSQFGESDLNTDSHDSYLAYI